MPKTVELTDKEVEDVIAGLRLTERSSRAGFTRTLMKMVEKDESPESIAVKVHNAQEVFKRIIALRARLGDTKPVEVER